MVERICCWFERIDPGVHRRVKGLRLVAAYGIAAMLGALVVSSHRISGGSALIPLAAGFGLWASVSEGQATRWLSTRDLVIFNAAAVAGASIFMNLSPISIGTSRLGPEWILITGAFLVGYLKRFGMLGAGIGSQIYIGQLLAYGTGITRADLAMVALAGLIATVASIVPRLLSGPAEHPMPLPAPEPSPASGQGSRELRMGLQSAVAALVIVLISSVIHLQSIRMGHHSQYLCDRRVNLRNCRSRSPADRGDIDRRSARHRLPANRTARTAAGLDTRCYCHDHLRCGLAGPLRHRLRSLCVHANGNVGDKRRNFNIRLGRACLGNVDRRSAGRDRCEGHSTPP